MIKVVGIRFRNAGKIYYFDPLDFDLDPAMHVIVETARGIEMGTVMIAPKEVEDDKVVQPLKPVIRVATDADEKVIERNREKEKEAFKICKEKIIKHELEMKLVEAEYTFDNNKLLFYFTADGRIDFRELVKDLAAVFRTRIELRQIGVRDETKIMGGIGICGRELCCKSYLADFVPVSIKMAKEQNLSLNPTKISGVCGRLMCCLKNEQETYEYLNSRLPFVGDAVTTDDGFRGEVMNISVLRQLVKVLIDNGDEKELREYHVDQLSFRSRRRKDVKLTPEELKELKALEDIHEAELKAENENHSHQGKPNNNNRRNPNNGGRANYGNRDNNGDRANDDRRDNNGNRANDDRRDNNGNRANDDRRDNNGNRANDDRRDNGGNRMNNERRDSNGNRAGSDRRDNNRNRDNNNRRTYNGDNERGERQGSRNKRHNNNRRDFEGKRKEQSKEYDAE